jgi:hypothetical protein
MTDEMLIAAPLSPTRGADSTVDHVGKEGTERDEAVINRLRGRVILDPAGFRAISAVGRPSGSLD